jgi:nucleoside-diphosphate-sugar epimerase
MCEKKKNISILGCGWIGTVVRKKLESMGHEVNCLSRDIGMNAVAQLYACDVLLIAIPPSSEYLEVLDDTLFYLDAKIDTQVIFLSSISFYEENNSIIEAEKLVETAKDDAVILRLGGLMGYDRIAGKYTIHHTIEDSVTQYVHRDDVVEIISEIIKKDIRKKIFDVVAPIQSTKKEIFSQNAEQFHFGATYFSGQKSVHKIISSNDLCETLGYQFQKEDVKNFWR